MLRLNILPTELKQEIKQVKLFYMLKRMGILLAYFLVIYAVMLVSSNQILKKYSEDTFSNQASIGKNSLEYIEKVKNINEQVNNVAAIQKEFSPLSDFLVQVTDNLNEGIKISQLSIEKDTGVFVLSGTADSRDSLLKLKSSLESLDSLSEISLPINNLLRKDDINFTITAKISKYAK